MKLRKETMLIVIFVLHLAACMQNSEKRPTQLSQELEKGFVNPPDSIQTSVYWYWISDNISKEAAVKDLHAMKAVGINRAFIGNIGLEDLPAGKVKMFSDEWWEILHTALKTATELNIEIGIFNSPGWSQSGGPWVKPEQAMRYLTASETRISGPKKIAQKLSSPANSFQDVKVLAWRENRNGQMAGLENAIFSSQPAVSNLEVVFDNDPETDIVIPAGEPFTIDIQLRHPFAARSLTIRPTKHPITAEALFQVKENGDRYRTIREFNINRSNPSLNVGFIPDAPIVIALPETESESFRLIIDGIEAEARIADILLETTPKIENFSEKTLAKMWPTPLPLWDAYLWKEQPDTGDTATTVKSDEVLDISQYMNSDGTLIWNVPEGDWVVMRLGMTPTGITNAPASPEATGLEIDKMSKKHIESHFNAFLGEILKRVPEADRKCFKVVVQDSYEMGGQNFTDGFIEDFKQRYGYDPTPYLPTYSGYVINSRKHSDRFLWDMRRMVADKVAYDYVGGLRDISNKQGLTTWLENYGHWGFPSEFLMYGGQSDEIGGEFWSEGSLGDIENRAATSCGHIYGKNKISAESNTSGGPAYSRYPATMKQRNDRFFAEGINNTLLHVYIMQPYEDKNPGVNAWFGNEFDRKNTWFSQLGTYIHYLKRVNFMLQQGLNVADVAYFIGEDTPKMTGITDPPLPVGYQFDYINAEVIEQHMTVKNGLLTLPHGTQYRILVLPKLETMRPELLKKIEQLVWNGAVVMGPAPERSPSLQNQPEADVQIEKISRKMWDGIDGERIKSRRFGKGTVLNGMDMKEALNFIGCPPDCKLPANNTIHYGHRKLRNGTEIYFVSNQTDEEQVVAPEFRVKALQPELWEPASGYIRFLPAFENKDGATAVPLKLAPFESAFIVFRHPVEATASSADVETNYPTPRLLAHVNRNWTVSFDPLQGGPSQPVLFDTLRDWTTFSDKAIKYYSGTASYRNFFAIDSVSEGSQITIDLGNLTAMGKIYVNDMYAGGVWTYPYRLNITPFVKEGTNTIKIDIVNNWMNRIIGDLNTPHSRRITWCFVNPYSKDSALQPSGLFGPVAIHAFKYR